MESIGIDEAMRNRREKIRLFGIEGRTLRIPMSWTDIRVGSETGACDGSAGRGFSVRL